MKPPPTGVTEFDAFDHEAHMERALELARSAADRGDEPFGSVLVRNDAVVMEARNAVATAEDVRRHPELDLARRAAAELPPDERAATAMYTSTEPCPMCSGGIRIAGLGRVVYSAGADDVAEFTGGRPGTRAADVLDDTEVVGPVLHEAGRAVHEAYGW